MAIERDRKKPKKLTAKEIARLRAVAEGAWRSRKTRQAKRKKEVK